MASTGALAEAARPALQQWSSHPVRRSQLLSSLTVTTDPQASVPLAQSLRVREAGLPLDTTLYEGVPPHLDGPLRAWARAFIAGALEQRVALQMGITTGQSDLRAAALDAAHGHPSQLVDLLLSGSELLEAIDRALQLDQQLHWEVNVVGMEEDSNQASLADWIPLHRWPRSSHRATAVAELAQLLRDAASAYRVSWDVPLHLTRRVDPTVQAAADETAAAADPATAELLRNAWTQIYGRDPNPTNGYGTAVRAVETVACPLVLPNNQSATLGQVIAHLRDAPGQWELGLVDKNGHGSIEPLVAMLERLWQAQVSRHGGGASSRDQTQDEAEAAIHLAMVCVHWLSTDVLRRR